MLELIADSFLALVFGVLFIFVTILGERYRFRVQRGWYLIVIAFGLIWLGSVLDLANGLYPILTTPFFQHIIKFIAGQVIGPFLLLLGLLLWAPRIAASREAYLLRIKTSEQRYRMLAEKASDMLAEYDMEGRFLFVTPGAQRIVGYLPSELVGRSKFDFIHEDQLGLMQLEHNTIPTRDEPVISTYKFKHRDGHYIWLESVFQAYQPNVFNNEQRVISISRDVSSHMQYENSLRDLNRNLQIQKKRFQLLYGFSTNTHLPISKQFELALEPAANTLGMELGIISKINKDIYEISHFFSKSSNIYKGQRFDLRDTYCSITIEKMEVVAINEMSQSEFAHHPCWNVFQLESYIGVPIIVQGKVYGTLTFSNSRPRETGFSEADKDFIRLMGQWLSRVLEREQANRELQQSEERYKAVINSSVVGVILIDTLGIIQSFNSAAENIFDYKAGEVIGRSVRILMHNSDYAEDDLSMKDYLENQLPQFIGTTREVAAQTKTGRIIHIEMGISEVLTESQHYYSGTVMDISARKQTEADLANAHLRLKNVFESATQVAIISTDIEGRINIFNPGAERILGYSAEEVVGKSTEMFHLKSEIDLIAKNLSSRLNRKIEGAEAFFALAKLGGQSEQEWTYIRKDGSELTVNSAITALYDTSGAITGFLGIILDITSWKQAEETLKLAKTAAEEANQTKSEFLANMSHELRTPLNSVIGFSTILLQLSTQKLNEKEITYLERILNNGKHLLDLINDILDLSKIEAGKMDIEIVEIDMGQQIKEIIGLVEAQARKKSIEINAVIPEDLIPSRIDPGKLKQVLLNLISNAIKFTDQGSVTVKLVKHPTTSRVSEIQVIDTGVGIPENRLKIIFDEFAQVDSSTRRKYGGTGLGLSISRRMCQLMGCELNVESTVGKGSIFTISSIENIAVKSGYGKRLRAENGIRSNIRSQHHPTDKYQGRRILIVDNEDDSQILLSLYLADTGCDIDYARSVDGALARIREKRPDLITLDPKISQIDTHGFLETLQADQGLKTIPVIVVSVIAREKRGQLPGVVDFIQKPVSRQQLLWAVRRNMPGRKKVLLVEKKTEIHEILVNHKDQKEFELHSAPTRAQMFTLLDSIRPDLIIVNSTLPDLKASELLEFLKSKPTFDSVQVIIVTEKTFQKSEAQLVKASKATLIQKEADFSSKLLKSINLALKS